MSIFQFFSELFGKKNEVQEQGQVQEESFEEEQEPTYAAIASFADKEETNDGKFILYGLIVQGNEEYLTIGQRFKLEVDGEEYDLIERNKNYPIGVRGKQVINISWKYVN
ncbi:hypothetical protein ACIQYL_20255 [Lysinibacillus xylanilyticus]|uniref:hypothetical protein n=1 Tax=Lysinibacillus xylanilyticus TaxID=582475 RepID=UPI00380A1BBB